MLLRRETLDTLPEETLWQVVQSVPTSTQRIFLLTSLSLVNRKLHTFARPHILETVAVENKDKWRKLVAFNTYNPDVATFIKDLRISPQAYLVSPKFETPLHEVLRLLPTIRRLFITRARINPECMRQLLGFKNLRHLTIAAHTCEPVLSFASLTHLRLQLFPSPRDVEAGLAPLLVDTRNTLETLAIIFRSGGYPRLPALHFPRLRNLRIKGMPKGLPRPTGEHEHHMLFQFIRSHPGLRQCNVDLEEAMEASTVLGLLKPPANEDLNGTVTQTTGSGYFLDAFAFCREPSPHGDNMPAETDSVLWNVTQLVLRVPYWDEVIADQLPLDFHLVPELGRRFPLLETLTLHIECHINCNFDTVMANLRDMLSELPHLKILSFAHIHTRCSTGFDFDDPEGLLRAVSQPLCPPISWDTGEPLCLSGLDYHNPIHLAELGISSEHNWETAMIHAWEAHHYVSVAAKMRRLAEVCPNLEQINWHVSPTVLDCESGIPLWKWRISRNAGSVRLVVGDLSWYGSIRGDPDELRILVGEELRIAVERASPW